MIFSPLKMSSRKLESVPLLSKDDPLEFKPREIEEITNRQSLDFDTKPRSPFNKLCPARLGNIDFLVFITPTNTTFSTVQNEELYKKFVEDPNRLGNIQLVVYKDNIWKFVSELTSETIIYANLEYYLCRSRGIHSYIFKNIRKGINHDDCKCLLV